MNDRRAPKLPVIRVPQMSGHDTLRNHARILRNTIAIHGSGMTRPAICNCLDEIAKIDRLVKFSAKPQ